MKKKGYGGAAVFAAAMLATAGLGCLLMQQSRSGGSPVFVGGRNYWRLFMQDDIFLRALWNTLWFPMVLGCVLAAGFVILKRLALNRWNSRLREPVCYTGLVAILFAVLAVWLPSMSPFISYVCFPPYSVSACLMMEVSLFIGLLAFLADRILPERNLQKRTDGL